MKHMLVLSAVGSVLGLSLGSVDAAAAERYSLQGLVHKVQLGGDKAPGARGQDGGGKSTTTPGSREGGGGPGAGEDKGGDRGARPEKGAGAEKGAGPGKADRGTHMRSGEKGTRGGQRNSERGGRTDVDVDVRGGRGDRTRQDRRTRVDIDADRGRRARGRDVDVNVRGFGFGPSSGVSCQDILRRYRQCVGR